MLWLILIYLLDRGASFSSLLFVPECLGLYFLKPITQLDVLLLHVSNLFLSCFHHFSLREILLLQCFELSFSSLQISRHVKTSPSKLNISLLQMVILHHQFILSGLDDFEGP